ncbi:MAG: NAD(P)H-hydrate dehydratase, partial [Zestosphaera sp.]
AAGADLVYLAAPEYVLKTRFSPEIIGVPLTGDYLTQDTVSGLTDLIKRVDVVATGPGLTVRDETRGFLKDLLRIVRESGKALVLDADALKMVKEGELNGMTAIMTPHLGEAAKLLETDIEDMKTFKDTVKGRITVAREIVDRYKATLILKGYVDVVMSPDGRMKTRVGVGHQDMSCGGTGDVLTGITATSLARTGDAFRAASAAAFINAVAGELAYLTDGRSSPTNILKYVPQVVRNPLKTALKVKELRSSV